MKDRELLSIKTDDTGFAIVDNDVYIGSPSDDSEEADTVISWRNGILSVDDWPLTPAMVKVLKMYIEKEL
jgi:ferric-dicitrate binding protein FerR (iron transport regulator)